MEVRKDDPRHLRVSPFTKTKKKKVGKMIEGTREKSPHADTDGPDNRDDEPKAIISNTAQEVKKRVDIVKVVQCYIGLSDKGGGEWIGLCPFHKDTKPSLSVSSTKGVFNCFGCGASGDVITFIEKIKGISFQEALAKLASDAGITITKKRPPAKVKAPIPSEPDGLTLAQLARAKGFTVEELKGFGLTEAEIMDGGKAVRIPYHGEDGKETGHNLRLSLDGENKFRWTPGKPKFLYGLEELEAIRRKGWVVLCEGESDLWTLRKHGYSVLALPGANILKTEWVQYFDNLDPVYVIIEPDTGGKAVVKLTGKRLASCPVVYVRPPCDVNELYLKDKAGFKEAFDKLLTEAQENGNGVLSYSTWVNVERSIGPITWAWETWLPNGLLTILAGETGCGKSALALRIAASFINGNPFPDGSQYTGQQGRVLWVETEAAQAINLERSKAWGLPRDRFVNVKWDGLEDIFLDDPEAFLLLRAKAALPEVKLIVVDSLSGGYRGRENSSETLQIMVRLATVARDTGKPVLVVHHFKKTAYEEGHPIQDLTLDRLRGSSAIVQPARVVWVIDTPDLINKEKHRLSIIKNNLVRFADPIGFKITDTGLTFGRAPQPPKKETQVDVAADLLLSLLRKKPLPASEIQDEADGAGISWRTINRAKARLGINAVRKEGRWLWSLPAEEEKTLL